MSNSTPNPLPFPESDSTETSDLGPPIFSDSYDGISRYLYPRKCQCGKLFYLPKHLLQTNRFCSNKCSAKTQQNRVAFTCATCGTQFQRPKSTLRKSKTGHYFCSRVCKDKAQAIGGIEAMQPAHYGIAVNNYRIRALRHYGAKCSNCGYDAHSQMLDVDHIDSDHANNALENLQVLCVWCHALKTRGVPFHECAVVNSPPSSIE
jgi:hypothetical protein